MKYSLILKKSSASKLVMIFRSPELEGQIMSSNECKYGLSIEYGHGNTALQTLVV